MPAVRVWFHSLPLTIAAATVCTAVPAYGSSDTPVQAHELSAIAHYQRAVRPSYATLSGGQFWESTAFLIDNGNDAAPALVVSSGHGVHKNIDSVAQMLPGKGAVSFEKNAGAAIPVSLIRYTSLRGLDFSVLELQQTQGALKALGIVPMKLAGRTAAEGEAVTAAARLSGSFQSTARWGTQELARINPGTGRGFLNRHLLVMDGVRLQQGDSGSPVVDQVTGAVLAVMHSADSREAYASDLSFIPGCLQNGEFDINIAGCSLSNAFNVAMEDDEERLIYKIGGSPALISHVLHSTTTLYQAKLAQWPEQCEEADGYGAAQVSGSALNVPIEDIPLAPANPTVLALCVWGLEATGPAPANRSAVALPVVVLPPGPAGQPELDIGKPYKDSRGRNAYHVTVEPEQIVFRQVELKTGPWNTTDCADESGYQVLAGSRKVLVSEQNRLCAVGVDYAGQRSQPLEVKLLP